MISANVNRALNYFITFNVNALTSKFDLISSTGHFSRYITEVDNDNIKDQIVH